MAQKRKAGNRFGGPVIALVAAGFIAAVFAAGLWAGMQFGSPPDDGDAGPSQASRESVSPTRAQTLSVQEQTEIPPARMLDQQGMDRLVERIANAPSTDVPPPAGIVGPDGATGADAALAQPPRTSGVPAWIEYAVASAPDPSAPKIALVIDDVGIDRRRSDAVAALPGPLTLSFLTYARELIEQTAAARARGHEIMVHIPMQPKSADADPGPNVLRVRDKPVELARKLDWGLSRFEGFVGVNNHMGSRFTTDRGGMNAVMAALKKRGLFFLDSVTASDTAGPAAAESMAVPILKRDVFLDNEDTPEEVRYRLEQAERIARRTGAAIAIGHPHDATITVLRDWIPDAKARGFAIVPITAMLRQRYPKLWRSAQR